MGTDNVELSDKIAALEDEINVLKVEVKAVLVDIRDELIKRDGPFATAPATRPAPTGSDESEGDIGDPGFPNVVRLHSTTGPESPRSCRTRVRSDVESGPESSMTR